MDRDRSENVVDPVERVGPSTGGDDTGDVGSESARIHEKRDGAAAARPSEPEPVEPPSDDPPIPDAEDLPGTPRPAAPG